MVVAGNVTRLTLAPFGPVRTTDVFAARLDSSGQLVYSKIFGGQGNDTAAALAVDAAGRAFLAGQTRSLDFPVTSNALQPQIRGAPFDGQIAPDGFITQLDASGEILYSTCLGGTGEDTPSAIAIDRQGNAFVAGLTRSSDFPVTGDAMQPASAGAAKVRSFVRTVTRLSPRISEARCTLGMTAATYTGTGYNNSIIDVVIDDTTQDVTWSVDTAAINGRIVIFGI